MHVMWGNLPNNPRENVALCNCSVALSGAVLVSGGADKRVKVWSLAEGASDECVATLEGHAMGVCGVALSPLADRVVSLSGGFRDDGQYIEFAPA